MTDYAKLGSERAIKLKNMETGKIREEIITRESEFGFYRDGWVQYLGGPTVLFFPKPLWMEEKEGQ